MELKDLNPADHMVTDEELLAFVTDAVETDDDGYIAHALTLVERVLANRLYATLD